MGGAVCKRRALRKARWPARAPQVWSLMRAAIASGLQEFVEQLALDIPQVCPQALLQVRSARAGFHAGGCALSCVWLCCSAVHGVECGGWALWAPCSVRAHHTERAASRAAR